MSGLFAPSKPAVPEPIKPPTTDDARQADEDIRKLRRRRGLASTFLTGQRTRASSSLLGAGSGDTMAAAPPDSAAAGGGGSPGARTRMQA